MRHLATFFAIAILAAGYASAQTTTNGALKLSSVVVTNEQDLVGIEFARTNQVMKIYNPANSSEWIDGAGNKYVVSNLWSMTFSADFGQNVFMPTENTNYTFNSLSQVIIEGTSNKWWLNPSYINHFPGGFYNREWRPTTNSLILDPVSGTGATGHAYISPYSTTNIAMLATEAQLILKADAAHTNQTDNPHLTTASQVGTLTGEEITNLVAQASSTAFTVNLTTNKLLGFTFAPTNATYRGDCVGGLGVQATVSVPIGTNGNYAFAWGCTNTSFTSVEGAFVTGEFFCSENETSDITAKIEIYRRDIATDTMSEWGDGGATFTVPSSSTPVSVPFRVWVPDVTTNAFRIWARVKRVGGGATSVRSLIVGSGTGYATHFSLGVPASIAIDAHNADAAAHPALKAYRAPFATYTDLTGSITLTNNLEAPISISGTGSISVAFSGLVAPYPVYFTAQGFSSITFPAGSYLVGGGMWQTNRVNHFIVWQHSTNLFINPLLSTEIPE